jgi:hypothetical protein
VRGQRLRRYSTGGRHPSNSLMFTRSQELSGKCTAARSQLEELGSEFPAEPGDKSDQAMRDAGAKVAAEQHDKLTPVHTSEPEPTE